MTSKKISIVIPCYNNLPTLPTCINSIYKHTTYPDFEIIVVDDGSTDGSLNYLKNLDNIQLIEQAHSGTAAALNRGFKAAGKNDVVRFHADIVIETPNWLSSLVKTAQENPQAGVIGVKLVQPSDRIQAAGRNILTGMGLRDRHANQQYWKVDSGSGGSVYEVDTVPGALAFYKRETLNKTGGLDENYYPTWLDDDDFCLMARYHSFKVYANSAIKAVHYTYAWGPSDFTYMHKTNEILEKKFSIKPRILERHYQYWQAKWGWDPMLPDLNEIRRLYGSTEICWRIGKTMQFKAKKWPPDIDVCLVTWNSLEGLKRCLDSVAQTNYPKDKLHIYVANNASSDGTTEYLDQLKEEFPFPLHVSHLAVNTGAPAGLNWSFVQGNSELFVKMDDDISVPPDWLKKMVENFRKRPYAGAVGCKVLNDNMNYSIQGASFRFFPVNFSHDDELDHGQANYLCRAVHVKGCCVLYRRDVLKHVGLLDVRYSPSQIDDVDHQMAAQIAGFEILYDGNVTIIHKLTDGRSRSYAAVGNIRANDHKLKSKWDNDIYEILDKTLDLSVEGRNLPADGDTSAYLSMLPPPSEFPKKFQNAISEKEKSLRMNIVTPKYQIQKDFDELVEDHIAYAKSLHRDGWGGTPLDVMLTTLNLAPYRIDVMKGLADSFRFMGQYYQAKTMLQRALTFEPDDIELQEKLEDIQSLIDKPIAPPTTTSSEPIVPEDGWTGIGEENISVRAPSIKTSKSKLKVLMVDRFETAVAGGDKVQLKKTKQYLEEMGVTVDVAVTPGPDPTDYDIAHVWNLWFPHQQLTQIKAIRVQKPEIPIVLSPIYWDMAETNWARNLIPQLFETNNPEQLDNRLEGLAANTVTWNGLKRTDHYEPNFRGFETYQRKILEMVDYMLPLSYAELRHMKSVLGITKPYTVVRNAAENKVFETADPNWFIREYGIRDFVLTCGVVECRKNQLLLLYALKDTGLPIVVVGRQTDRHYTRLCKKHAPPNTIFIEHLPHELLASGYKAARVHALPSWMECASLVNIEAALSGCNLVVSNRTSEPEYFQDNAYFCDPADTKSIRQAVLDAYNNYEIDIAKREHLKQLFSNDYTWQKAAELTLEAYEKLLAKKQTSSTSPKKQSTKSTSKSKKRKSVKSKPTEQKTIAPASVILHATDQEYTTRCLEAIKSTAPDAEIIIVDDGAQLPDDIQADRIVRFNTPVGIAKSFNAGATYSESPYVICMEDKAQPQEGWFQTLTSAVENDDKLIGALPMILATNGTLRHIGSTLSKTEDGILQTAPNLKGAFSNDPRVLMTDKIDVTFGEALLLKRNFLVQEYWLDEAFIDQMAFIDLSLKAREKGLKFQFVPQSKINWTTNDQVFFSKSGFFRLNQIWAQRTKVDAASTTTPVPEYTRAIQADSATVDIVIPIYGQPDLLKRCVESVLRTAPQAHLILVDDCTPGYDIQALFDNWKNHPRISLAKSPTNQGFIGTCKLGANLGIAPYILFLNSDTEAIEAGWLDRLIPEDNKVGVVGARLLYPPSTPGPLAGTIQHAGVARNAEGIPYHPFIGWPANSPEVTRVLDVNAVTGACFLVKRKLWDELGGWDTRFGKGVYEDVDFCWRARQKGYIVRYQPFVTLFHYESASKAADGQHSLNLHTQENLQKLLEKWSPLTSDEELFYGPKTTSRWKKAREQLKSVQQLAEQGKNKEAFMKISQTAAQAPDLPEVLISHAQFLSSQGNHTEAAKQLSKAVKYSPTNWNARLHLIDILVQANQPEQAAQELIKIKAVFPEHPEVINRATKLHSYINILEKQSPPTTNAIPITAPSQTASPKLSAAELFETLLSADNITVALKEHEHELDQDLLALIQQNIQLARSDGDFELAEGLETLVEYINQVISTPRSSIDQPDPVATFEMLLQADDIEIALTQNAHLLNTDLLNIVKANAEAARNDNNPDLAEGLQNLAIYIEQVIEENQNQGTIKPEINPEETLSMLLDSEDIVTTLQTHQNLLTPELLTLVKKNVQIAMQDNNPDLAEGLQNLAEYIEQVINS